MTLPDFLTEWPHREIVLTGHRIGLFHVIGAFHREKSRDELHEEFPTLPLGLIDRTLEFYQNNKAFVDEYIANCQSEIDRQRSQGKHVDVAGLRDRLEQRQHNSAK
jgi:uncharacterized protein (DUF433 family)